MTTDAPKPRKRRPAAAARWVAAGLSATATLGIVTALAATDPPEPQPVSAATVRQARPIIIRRIIRRHVARPTIYRRVVRHTSPGVYRAPSAPATTTSGS